MLRVDSLWENADDIICGDILGQRVSGIMLVVRCIMMIAVVVGADDDGGEHDDDDDDDHADILLLRMVAISMPRKWSWLVVVWVASHAAMQSPGLWFCRFSCAENTGSTGLRKIMTVRMLAIGVSAMGLAEGPNGEEKTEGALTGVHGGR